MCLICSASMAKKFSLRPTERIWGSSHLCRKVNNTSAQACKAVTSPTLCYIDHKVLVTLTCHKNTTLVLYVDIMLLRSDRVEQVLWLPKSHRAGGERKLLKYGSITSLGFKRLVMLCMPGHGRKGHIIVLCTDTKRANGSTPTKRATRNMVGFLDRASM